MAGEKEKNHRRGFPTGGLSKLKTKYSYWAIWAFEGGNPFENLTLFRLSLNSGDLWSSSNSKIFGRPSSLVWKMGLVTAAASSDCLRSSVFGSTNSQGYSFSCSPLGSWFANGTTPGDIAWPRLPTSVTIQQPALFVRKRAANFLRRSKSKATTEKNLIRFLVHLEIKALSSHFYS